MKRVFLTGSTSYLGTKFIELYGNQFEIYGIARSDPDHPIDLLEVKSVQEAYMTFLPDIVIHTAADVGRDASTSAQITETNPAITKTLVDLAKPNNTPFIFTSTEAVYGGKEQTGEYVEADTYKPRSPYGQSKVESEKIIMASGLPYLITRGHRYVGISRTFNNTKQFPDTTKALTTRQEVHLDSRKLFKPVLINHICDIFAYYIEHDTDKQILINIGVDKATTFYDFMKDVAGALGIDEKLVLPDGEELGWPPNSTLSIQRFKELGYPTVDYEQVLETIKKDAR